MKIVDFAFVWQEEQAKLFELASSVPVGGRIVEIGTAVGGTSVIFARATSGKGVRIYTVDPHASLRAKEHLKETTVVIVTDNSENFSERWPATERQPIDFLYIDGDHTFRGIYTDFFCWQGFVSESGCITFHDYDPVNRGGVAHFAIRVFMETMIRKGAFVEFSHDYKLFTTRVDRQALLGVKPIDFFQEMSSIFTAADSKAKDMFASSVSAGMNAVKEKSITCDGFELCYLVDYALHHDFECLDVMTHSFYDFRRWAEALSFLDHGCGKQTFLEYLDFDPASSVTIEELSSRIALLQLRISLCALVLGTLVPWKP